MIGLIELMLEKIKHYLKELGFKHNEIIVYIALTQLGESAAAKIAKKANLPRTTVISILNKLAEENYLTTHKYRGTTYFWIESPKTLIQLLESKITLANQLNDMLTDLYRSESHFPFAYVYDTKKGIRKFIEKLLISLEKKSVIQTIDVPEMGNYHKIYSDDISKVLVGLKNNRQITTRTLVPHNSYKNIASHKITSQNIKIRELPLGINFQASLWVLKDMIVHFSGNPPFIVAIKHELIVSSLTSVYEHLWNISEAKN